MTKQTISLGSAANDGTGDTLRQAGQKINDNFDEVYARLNPLVHNTQTITANNITVNADASAIFIDSVSGIFLGDGTYPGEVKYFINIGTGPSVLQIGTYGPTETQSSSNFNTQGQCQGFIWHTSGWYLLSSRTIN